MKKYRLEQLGYPLPDHGEMIEDDHGEWCKSTEAESELKQRDDLLQRIFDYHISYGFGDDGSFESFADEITDLI